MTPARPGTLPRPATFPRSATLPRSPIPAETIPAPSLAPIPVPSPAPILAAAGNAPPARKPLRIVYLNEIGKEPVQSADLASRQPAFLRLSTTTDWTLNQDHTPIIKIDISSPNH